MTKEQLIKIVDLIDRASCVIFQEGYQENDPARKVAIECLEMSNVINNEIFKMNGAE